MTTYSVENGTGDASGEGMTREQAMRAAQTEAARTGQVRYVVSSDADEASVEVKPGE